MRIPYPVIWLLCCGSMIVGLHAEIHWPQFRGPRGNGHGGSERLPLEWSESKNIQWKTPIHGRAWSSPVVWGNRIWLSTATEDGRELSAICVDKENGKVLRDVLLFRNESPQFAHKFNSYASPTPVIEEGRVYITFGSPGTACLDTETGEKIWERTDFVCNHYRGAGSSPILHGDLLIMHFDGSDHQYVAALNKENGRTEWIMERSVNFRDLEPNGLPQIEGDLRKAFATPHVAEINGRTTLVSLGAKAAYGYDPMTGEELWRFEEHSTHSASTRPLVVDDVVYFASGFSRGVLFALRPEEKILLDDSHVLWSTKRSVANKPSLLHADGLLFMVNDGGIAACLDAQTGEVYWSERIGGNYSASPLYAGGKIYCFNEEGQTVVLEAGKEFNRLAENELESGCMASPAVSEDGLILRTKTHLYSIGNR